MQNIRIPQWPVASPTLKSSPSTPCSMSTFILGFTMDPCCDACVTLQTAFLPNLMQPKSQLWQEGRIRGCHRSCCHNHIALLVTFFFTDFTAHSKQIWKYGEKITWVPIFSHIFFPHITEMLGFPYYPEKKGMVLGNAVSMPSQRAPTARTSKVTLSTPSSMRTCKLPILRYN